MSYGIITYRHPYTKYHSEIIYREYTDTIAEKIVIDNATLYITTSGHVVHSHHIIELQEEKIKEIRS